MKKNKLSGIVSGARIDEAALELIGPYSEKIRLIEDKIKLIVEETCKGFVPEILLGVQRDYPHAINKGDSFQFSVPKEKCKDISLRISYKKQLTVYPNVPSMLKPERDAVKEVLESSEIPSLMLERLTLYREKDKVKNQIKCTLSKLKTYKKIEENFPEAYKCLEEIAIREGQIEKEKEKKKEKEPSLCDDVEKLRATLKSNAVKETKDEDKI